MDETVVNDLENIVGEKWVDTDAERVFSYAKEWTIESYGLVAPEPAEDCVVVKPCEAEEISEIMEYANENSIPVLPKGGNTALSANAIPDEPSIILVLERMNEKIEIDEQNMTVTCDAGVTLESLLEKLSEHDKLYFPLHPGDEGAQIGGMAIMNAGGVRAVRDGVMRDQIRGLKAVLPTGEIVDFGNRDGKLIKNNAGYDLSQLMIGSEGTLGIVTEVTLDLKPEPPYSATLIIPFEKRNDAFRAVTEILQEGIIPLAVEYVEREQILATAEDLGKEWPATEGAGDLMVILAEGSEEDLFESAAGIENICQEHNSLNTLMADTTQEEKELLEIRSHFLPAIEDEVVDCPDITVPRSELGDLMDKLDELSEEYDADMPLMAHAADGNLHAFIMLEDPEVEEIPDYYEELKHDMYQAALDLGGTITGEHGVGALRKEQLKMQYTEREMEIMKNLKKAFDPNNVLSPNRIVDID